MTMLPPPKHSVRGLLLLQTVDPNGQELRDSWTQTLGEIALSLPATRTPPAASVPSPDPVVGGYDSGEKIQAAISEVGLRLCARRLPADPKTGELRWSVDADGTSIAQVAEPLMADAQAAATSLSGLPVPPMAGLLGQRNWIAVYFMHHIGLAPVQHRPLLDLMDAALNVVMLPIFTIKNTAQIPRPWVLEPRLDPPRIDKGPLWHSSFPSGHATQAHACARLLGKLVGADANLQGNLDQLAAVIAGNREKAWVHTALDSAAGRVIGNALGQWLHEAATVHKATFPAWASMQEYARRQLP